MRSLFVTALIAAGALLYCSTAADAGCGPGCHMSALGADSERFSREVTIRNVFGQKPFERVDWHVGHGVARTKIMIAWRPRSAHRVDELTGHPHFLA